MGVLIVLMMLLLRMMLHLLQLLLLLHSLEMCELLHRTCSLSQVLGLAGMRRLNRLLLRLPKALHRSHS